MSSPFTAEQLQYLYCAVCLETQDLKPEVSMAITIVNGTATCEEHRRRVAFSFDSVVRNARKFLSDGPRSQRSGDFARGPRHA
jgi:hypothetical protein